MKIAIFGDIHGNIEALKAAYGAALSAGAEKMYHLGDLGGYAPFVNDVAAFLMEHSIEGVQGNYDDAVANDRAHCGCKAENPLQEEMANLSFVWTKEHISEKTKEYLGNLPSRIILAVEGKKIAIFHAAPHKNNVYWFEDRPEKFFREMAEKMDADIFIYGHTHIPYRKDMDGKIFINAGSVGKPKDGDRRTCVAVIDITRDTVRSEFLRVNYDVEKTSTAIIDSGLPEYYAEKLKKAE